MPESIRKARAAARKKAKYAASLEVRMKYRDYKLRKAYGITLEQYNTWNEVYDCVCHICSNPCPSGKSLAVDHEHSDMALVRGLLCINCNKGLGSFKDNVELLVKAIEYLKNFQEIKKEVACATNKVA